MIAPVGAMVKAGAVDLFCERFGDPADPPVLLLMGNSASGRVWPDAFCAMLAASGHHIIRFDQRDTGLSTYFDYDAAPYDLHDLARDAVGLLDALGIQRAHIAGLSQGGMLAYLLAVHAPDRLMSIAAMMSTPDQTPKTDAFRGRPPREGELPRPPSAYVAAVIALNSVAVEGPEAKARRFVDNFRLARPDGSPFDEAAWKALAEAVVAHDARRPDGANAAIANASNHARAQSATPPLSTGALAQIAVPTLILHGLDDPVFPPDHARWAADMIPGAQLRLFAQMGHALDPAFFAPVADALAGFWTMVETA